MPEYNTVSELHEQFNEEYLKLCAKFHLIHFIHMDYQQNGIGIKTDIVEYNPETPAPSMAQTTQEPKKKK